VQAGGSRVSVRLRRGLTRVGLVARGQVGLVGEWSEQIGLCWQRRNSLAGARLSRKKKKEKGNGSGPAGLNALWQLGRTRVRKGKARLGQFESNDRFRHEMHQTIIYIA
jgi:hypothetical protein